MTGLQSRPLRLAIAAAFAVAVTAGCARSDPASYIASANAYLAKSDYKAAIIELKNALQKAPDNAEARLLLAKSLLATGDAAGAETEVRKAIDAHAPGDQAYPVLAQVLGAQGKYKALTSELGDRKLGTPAARSEVNVALATATLAQGNAKHAKELADAALADRPANVRALLLEAQLAAQGGIGAPAVREFVDKALKVAPDDVEALLMKVELDNAEGKNADAQATLQHAVDTHPKSIVARTAAFSYAMRGGKLEAAKAQLAKMKEVAPGDLRTVYSDALLSAMQGDNAHAREQVQRILAAQPDNLPSLYLSGMIDYQMGSYASAEDSLRRVVAKAPADPSVRRVLALLYLRTGRPQQAVDTLTPALQRYPDNPVLLRIAGEAYLASGNIALAERVYEQANSVDKNNVGSEVRLAQVRLAAGDSARGFSDLESLAAKDSSASQADMALFSAHMQRREYDKALADVDVLEKKQPKAAIVQNLRGVVYMAKRDLKDAQASFEKALELQPDFLPAARNLAIIDLQRGDVQAARDRYDKILAKNPKNGPVLLALAELQGVAGATPDDIRKTIEKAVAADPASPASRLALIAFEERQKDVKGAVATAQAALAAIPGDPQLTGAVGATQLVAGQYNEAVESFKKLVLLQPQNPLTYLQLAQAQVALKDYAGAIDSERKALALKPDLPQAVSALAQTYLVSGRADEAVAQARGMQKEHPNSPGGYALEGDIYSAQKKWSEASLAYKMGLDRKPLAALAARYYVALTNAGNGSAATAAANKWMTQHPDDPSIPLMLAEQHQQQKDLTAAKAGYRKVLAIDADNVVALNNLAFLLTEDKDPKGLEYAEHAHRLAPFNPSILDTYGWSLMRNGQAALGAKLLRMATSLAPAVPEIRLHLAQALAESGDKAGARKELTELTKLDKASPIRADAEKLLGTL